MASVLMVIVVLFFLCHSSRIIVNFYEALQVSTINMFWGYFIFFPNLFTIPQEFMVLVMTSYFF